jgi:dihydroorotate dehydrogenase
MALYQYALRPILFSLPPEDAHHVMSLLASLAGASPLLCQILTAYYAPKSSEKLKQQLFGKTLLHPVGLAAGFDKSGCLLKALQACGFSAIELGSFSAEAWAGNPKPRVFRLPQDHALINRMGLNNPGIQQALSHLDSNGSMAKSPESLTGLSMVKTPDPKICGQAGIDDFVTSIQHAAHHGDYLALNISCPNTEEGKTFEDPVLFEALLQALRATGWPTIPLLIKLSPDLDFDTADQLLEIGTNNGVTGWIVSNTSSTRDNLKTSSHKIAALGRGGLSGHPIQQRSTLLLKHVYQQTKAFNPILIGVGGIMNGEDAIEKIKAGAHFVQLYTGLIYKGPGLIKAVCSTLENYLKREGLSTLQQLRGQGSS